MGICTLKTKNEVMYEPISQAMSFIYLEVKSVSISSTGYFSRSDYYAIKDGKQIPLRSDSDGFSRGAAVQLFAALGADGTNFDEQLFNLIPKVALYSMGQSSLWGLTGNDWEIVP